MFSEESDKFQPFHKVTLKSSNSLEINEIEIKENPRTLVPVSLTTVTETGLAPIDSSEFDLEGGFSFPLSLSIPLEHLQINNFSFKIDFSSFDFKTNYSRLKVTFEKGTRQNHRLSD